MYLFVDTETGGLTTQHSLLTASLICVDKNFDIIPRKSGEHGLHLKIQHDDYVLTAGALTVNNISIAEHHKEGLSLQAAKSALLYFLDEMLSISACKRFVPAGHNVSFDVKFLQHYLLTDAEWNKYFTYPALDTAAAARWLHTAGRHPGGYALSRLRDSYAPHMRGQLHDAETDNLTALEIAKKFAQMFTAVSLTG
mgnify:CR=1 FL=1